MDNKDKPILATTLAGLFIKRAPWKTAHVRWFADAAKKLSDPGVAAYATIPNYFPKVDEVMSRLHPHLSDAERTIKARELFFESVVKNIKENPSSINLEIIDYFKNIKDKYRVALITTNTEIAVKNILEITNLNTLFDFIETSLIGEKDDKILVFKRFIEKLGKPFVYLGGERKDSFDFCKANNIDCIFINLEGQLDLENVEVAHTLDELKGFIEHKKLFLS